MHMRVLWQSKTDSSLETGYEISIYECNVIERWWGMMHPQMDSNLRDVIPLCKRVLSLLRHFGRKREYVFQICLSCALKVDNLF